MPSSSDKGLVPENSVERLPERRPRPSQMEKRLLSIVEAAAWLGLSQSYLYKLVESKKIPYIRFGRAIRFDIKQLEYWISGDADSQRKR